MDTNLVATQCLRCGQQVCRSLRWFQDEAHVCAACGGDLDPEPLRRGMLAQLDELKRVEQ